MRRMFPASNRRRRRAARLLPQRLLRRTSRALFALCVTGLPNASWAGPDAEREAPASIEEVEVLGERERGYRVREPSMLRYGADSLQNVAQQITVVPQALLEDQGAATLQDALRNVTGIGISAGEGGAQGDNFTLRGYDAKSDIYIDGVRDSASYFRDAFNLESVEVTKGASATYFGRGTTGGAINQVSKRPQLSPIMSGIASVGTGRFLRLTGDVNVPFSETAAARVNFMLQDAEVVDRDEIESNRRGLAPSIAFGIGTTTQLTLSYLYLEEDNIPDYGLPYVDERPANVPRDTFFGLEDEDFEQTRVNVATLRLDHAFSDRVKLRNTTRFSHVNREAAPTAPRLCLVGDDRCAGSSQDGVRRNRPERDGQESIFSNQTDLLAELELGGFEHSIATGFEVSRETNDLERFSNPGPFSIGLDPTVIDPAVMRAPRERTSKTSTRASSYGIYLTDRVRLSEAFDLVAGVRWDSFDTRFDDRTPTGLGDTGPDFDRKDRLLGLRAGLLFHPTPEQTYYVSYGTSANPSAQALQLRERDAGTDPEENRTLELGTKLELRGGALSVQAAVFQIDKTDARETDEASGLQFLSGSQRVRGFELGVAGRVIEGWSLFAGYTFLDTELRTAATSTDSDRDGNELSRTPRHTATLWNSFTLPGGRFQLGGGPTYVSHRFSSTANTNEIDGFVRWDAALSYEFDESLTFRLNARNLADREYFEETSGGHAVPAAGRTLILSVQYTGS